MPDVVIYSEELVRLLHPRQGPARPQGGDVPGDRDRRDDALRDEMVARAGGRRTVPQVFIGETHVGGCDDLFRLESEGRLDALLT